MLLKLLPLFMLLEVSYANMGWDGIQAVSESGFRCLKDNGFSFFVARVWEEVCAPDNTGVQNIKNARAAGWEWVDGYIFPSHRSGCGGGAAQVKAAVDHLRASGAKFGQLWLDIERSSWPANQEENRAFITDMINEAKALVSASESTPTTTTGGLLSALGGLALATCLCGGLIGMVGSNFGSFGGWTKVAMKQYGGGVNGPCGVNMDHDWYP